jgi:hypothetical protein
MSTESQVKANRKNTLKSTGPRTEEGKDAASQNSVKHGLRAKRDVIKTENQDEFDIFRVKMIADISPDGAMEEMLAERIVSLSWRLKRAEHFQNAVIDALIEHGLHGASSGFGWTSDNRERAQKEAAAGDVDVMLGIVINHDFANAKTLDMLLSYERRIESSLYRTIAELKKVRQTFKEQDESGTCTNEANLKETAWAEANPTSDIDTCTNEPNFKPEYRTQNTGHSLSNEANLPASCEKSEYLIPKSKIKGGEPMNEQTNPNIKDYRLKTID